MAIPEGYKSVDLPFSMGQRALFKDGKLEIYAHEKEWKSKGLVHFSPQFHGPPRFVHGGAQSYILDEVMGCTCWMHGVPVVAKDIQIFFHKPVPLSTDLIIEGQIDQKTDRLAEVSSKICSLEGVVLATGEGRFRVLDEEKLKEFSKIFRE